jgi:adenine C2-methylase RlmN of 23S rRNA A2503 and tRNA A37
MGLLANLSSAEILEQVYLARSLLGEKHQVDLRNVVFMGMGEPLDNYDAVHEACRGLTHQCLFGFRAKHVTISTVGDAPDRIRQLADEAPQISLALSLHGATQELRLKLIPTAKRSPLEQLEEAMDYHALKSSRGAMLEYLLIDGVNDDDDAAKALVRFCRDRASAGSKTSPFVNLIPYNPTVAGKGFEYQTPSDDRIDTFHNLLREEGINSLVRWSSAKGRDADGACGQLALSVVKKAKESVAS